MSMDLDVPYNRPMVSDWLKYLQQVTKNYMVTDDEIGSTLQFKAIQRISVEVGFKIADYFGINPNTKFMAIFLYDKFMCKYFGKVYATEIRNGQHAKIDKTCSTIANKAKLYFLSCFQLACKMDSPSTKIEISEIINLLQMADSRNIYTRKMIISCEYEVFKTLGFKIPFYTPLTCIEFMFVTLKRSDEILREIALLLLEIAFLQHEKLYARFQQATVESMNSKKSTLIKSDILFLSASVVACSMLFRNDTDNWQFTMDTLADRSLSQKTDIMIMANVLFEVAMQG